MARKNWLIVGCLFLAGSAGADQVPENLRGINSSDVCKATVHFYIDGKEDITHRIKLQKVLDDYDALYSLNFTRSKPQCSVYIAISIEAMSTNLGYYVYTGKLGVFSADGAAFINEVPHLAKYVSFYDTSKFGIRVDKTSFYSHSEILVNDLLKTFALDWKKVH